MHIKVIQSKAMSDLKTNNFN